MYSHFSSNSTGKMAVETNRLSEILADSWSSRVAVRNSDIDLARYYDSQVPDFPSELVPFAEDKRYSELPLEVRNRILAAAWISYNEKTIAVENLIVAPACDLLLKGAFPQADSPFFKRLVAQTGVDEQFHILMSLEASIVARNVHHLESLRIPKATVVDELEKTLARASTEREKEIIRLAFATVAEVTINAYLNLLANDFDIQPLNRETTNLHRKDESSHNKIFKELNRCIYDGFEDGEKYAYLKYLAVGLKSFVKVDFTSWREILRYMHVQKADDIIATCVRISKPAVRDYSGLLSLLKVLQVSPESLDFNFKA